MRFAFLLPVFVLAFVSMPSCSSTPAPHTVGDVYVQGSVSSYSYYGEFREKREGGRDRIFLMFDPKTVEAFAAGGHELPMSRSLIGKGPNKETLIIEQVKDPEQSLIIARRLIKAFNAKNNASVTL